MLIIRIEKPRLPAFTVENFFARTASWKLTERCIASRISAMW